MKCFGWIMMLFAITGCCKKIVPQRTMTDSIVVKQIPVLRDTVVKIIGDTISLLTRIPCENAWIDTTILSSRGKLQVKAVNGKLSIQYQQDSLLQRIKVLEYELSKEKYITQVVEKPIEVIKHRLPGWAKWLMTISIFINLFLFRNPIMAFIKSMIR